MEIEIRHFRAFAAVARHRSFSRAADELLITQPALSRTVAQLEAALGVRLLERTSRRVEPTDAGTEFLREAERVLASFDHALTAARRLGVLRLGFSWLLPAPWAQRTIKAFEGSTGASVTLTRTDDPLEALRRRTVDIAVVRGDAAAPEPLRSVRLYDEPRFAVCARESPLAGRDHLDWDEVRDWRLIVNTVSGTTGPWSWPEESRPRDIVETANYDEWVETVAANRGIGIVPETARHRSPHPALRFVPLTDAPPVPVRLVHLPDGPRVLIRRFVDASLAAVAR
ncbi:LysR family transcriptional regulator [Streptomyces sp. KAU_LT]|uniref:LysR family transcriptional regulator n=1 Tax=Streptomyces sp. KAU_LT TaxID=3046669 RepID=UPI0024B7B8C3|nr:LysR family transcriptional regulator [Streptomyces sp. KAU_LT]MDI9832755.1 LysR family transcriptional regulator [Streptomyces sp. KAU_LT]